MKLVDFIEALEEAASKYMVPLRILVKTDNAVKHELRYRKTFLSSSIFTRLRALPIMYLWDGNAGCTTGTVLEVSGTVILLRTRIYMKRQVRQEMLLLLKSSLMMCLRYC